MVQDPWQIEIEAFPNNSNLLLLKTQMTILELEQTNYSILVLHNTKFCKFRYAYKKINIFELTPRRLDDETMVLAA
jgi:hypothetical protein